MAERRYTTKIRAKRIALDYFTRPHPLRSWKRWLSIALPLVAAGLLALEAVRGDQRVYTSGPVSTAHALFETRCTECHQPASPPAQAGLFTRLVAQVSRGVSVEKCETCHAGPRHFDGQGPETHACTSCHFEHQGRERLAAVADGACTQCHDRREGLPKTAQGDSAFTARIARFDEGSPFSHPPFKVGGKKDGVRPKDVKRTPVEESAVDTAKVRLNHVKHLELGLARIDTVRARTGKLGLREEKGQWALTCTYCHRLDEHRVSIEPIKFKDHCADCHPLAVDKENLPGVRAPHDTPAVVHAYLRTTLIEAFERCQAPPQAPSEPTASPEPRCDALDIARTSTSEPSEPRPAARPPASSIRRLPRAPSADEPSPEQPRSAPGPAPTAPASGLAAATLGWVDSNLPKFERRMFGQNCGVCHLRPAEPPPGVAVFLETKIPPRWLPHSRFDHGVHRPVRCTECHDRAVKSEKTEDVLLPSIASCRTCHRGATSAARTACVTCHLYHDQDGERDPSGPHEIPRLAGTAAAPVPARR